MNKLYLLPLVGIMIGLCLGCQAQQETQEETQKATEKSPELTVQLQNIIDKNIQNFDEAFKKSGLSETLQNYSEDFRRMIEQDFHEAFLKDRQEDIQRIMEQSLKNIEAELKKIEDFTDSNETKSKLEEGFKKLNEVLKSFKDDQ